MIQIYNNKHLTWDGTTSINHYELFADTVTDLPSDPYYFSSPDGGRYKMAQGSIAWVIDVSEIYMLDSEGTWVLETVSGGGGTDYDTLSNKPSINNVELSGNKTLSDLGIQPAIDSSHKLSADLVTDGTTNKFNMQADWTQTDNTSGDYIKNKPTLGTAAAKDVPVSGDASTTQVVMGDDSRLSDSRTPTAHNQASDTINAMTGYTAPVNPTTWQTVSASDTLNAATQKIVNNEELNKYNILLKANTSDVNTATENLQAQIDNIVTPVTQDAEVQNARVGADGTSYVSLKARLDAENNNVNQSIEYISSDVEAEINDKIGSDKYSSETIDLTTSVTTTGGVNGAIGSTINVTSSASYKHKKIDVAYGDYLEITIPQLTSATYPYYIIATDVNDVIVRRWGAVPSVAGVNSYALYISDSSIKYLYIMFKSSEKTQSAVKKTYISLQSQITSISDPTSDTLKEQLLEDKMYTVIELNQERRCFNFAFITDTHANGYENNNVRASENIDLLKRVCNLGMLDCGVHGGDIISAYDTTDEDYIKAICKYIQSYKNIDIPFYFAKGNHEINAEEGYVAGVAIEIPQYYVMVQNRLRNKNVVTNPEAPYDGYYYVDFEDTKIRLIVANVYRRADNGVNMNMGTKEEAWIYTKALDFTDKTEPTAWNVIVVSHFHFTDTANFTKMLQAFNDKGTRYGDYIFDVNNGGSIIAHIHGHSHIDEYSNAWGYNQIGVKKGFANVVSWGTTNEFCFDVFSVDLDNNKLYETRFGSGSSREYSWGAESNIRTD